MDATLDILFQQFLRERKYLRSVRPLKPSGGMRRRGAPFRDLRPPVPLVRPIGGRCTHLEEFVYPATEHE